MAKLNEEELKAQIKSGTLSNVYFIYGEEGYLKEHYVRLLKKKAVDPAFEDFNYHYFDGRDAVLDDILKDAEMLPMMGSYQFILVRDYPFDKSASDINGLKEFLKDVPQSLVLVFWYDALEIDIKKNNKWKGLEAAFAKAGEAVCLNKRSEGNLVQLIVGGAKKRGALLSHSNARYLISVVGSDIKTLLNELDKISSYANGAEITREIIDRLAVKCLQARVYDLSKAIIRGDADVAYAVLDSLFALKEEPVSVLAVISGCYVDMYRAKCAKIAGSSYEDVANYYNYKGREFALRNAMRDCSDLSVNQLRESLDVLQDADLKLKSTSVDKRLVLEEVIVKLLLFSKGAA